MSIQSTQHINRIEAINRISFILTLIENKQYNTLDNVSFEPDSNIEEFVNNCRVVRDENFEEFTNRMLEDIMDQPYFRYGMFDNYRIY